MASLCTAGPAAAAPTVRGFQISTPDLTEDLLDELKNNWKINYVRVSVGNNAEMDGKVGAAYDAMMEEQFTLLDQKLPLLAARNIKVTFVLYSPPGGFEFRSGPSHHKMFSDRSLQVQFINTWREIIARYGSNSTFRSFVLANEPAMRSSLLGAGAKDWNGLLLETISAIRETNSTVELEVPPVYGNLSKLRELPPIADTKVSYDFNPYLFLDYQHSGIGSIAPFSIAAPSAAASLSKLRRSLSEFYLRVFNRVQSGALPKSAFPPRLNVGEVAISSCASDSGAFIDGLLAALETDDSAASRDARAPRLSQYERAQRRYLQDLAAWNKRKRGRKPQPPSLPVFSERDFRGDVEVRSYAIHAAQVGVSVWDPRTACDSSGNLSRATEDTDRGIVIKGYLSRNP